MAENREFRIIISATSQRFQKALRKAQGDLRRFNKQATTSFSDIQKTLRHAGGRMKDVGQTLTTRLSAPLMALGGLAVNTAMNFDSAMNKVKAISGATGDDFDRLKETARELGSTTQFSASQAAEGMSYLAMAGFETNEILSAMPGMLNLAAAGELELAEAADIASNILSGFGKEASEIGHVGDVLAKASSTANTNIQQLGNAMMYVGPVAKAAGISLEETTAAVGKLSDAGIQGEKAGTALRSAIADLMNPTTRVSDALANLGLTTEDVNPATNSLAEIMGKLSEAGATGADIMNLFGKEAGPGMLVLLEQGKEGIEEYTNTLKNSMGTASEQAKTRTEGLEGALNEMRSALEEVAIIVGENIIPVLLPLVDGIKKVAQWFGNLSPATQKIILVLGALATAIPPIIMGVGALAAAIGAVTAPVATAVGAIMGLVTIGSVLIAKWDDIKDEMRSIWNTIKNYFEEALEGMEEVWNDTVNAAMEFMESLWNGIERVGSTLLEDGIIGLIDEFILEPFLSIDLFETGVDMVKGLWEGLQSKAEWLKDKVIEWAKAVLPDPIEKVLGIASPSKVMRTIGQQSAEGLALGVSDGKSKVQQAVVALGNSMGDTIISSIDKYNKALYQMELQASRQRMEIKVQEMQKEIERTEKEVAESEERIAQLKKELQEYKKGSKEYKKISEDIKKESENLADAQERAAKARMKAEQDAKSVVMDALRQQRDLLKDVQDVWERHHQALAEAKEEYQRKVEQVNRQLAENERRLTEDLKRQIEQRAKDLMNWTGLFDAVSFSGEGVTGEELLGNLRDQVNAFDEWQEQIGLLAQKGVDDGLIKELRKMGPKALPQLKALNKMSDDELNEYVNLYRTKAQQAREEAMRQLEQQRRETQMKLMEIRADAQRQLEIYRREWAEKQREIRKNTMEELDAIEKRYKQMAENSTHYGVSLMENFISGVRGRFGDLRDTLEDMMMMVDMYMPHSPAKVGPLRKLDEYGPAMVQEIARGIQGSLPTLERAVNRMAQVPSMAAVGGGGGGSTTNNSHTTNYFNISIESDNAEEVWEKLQDELHRRGFDL